MKFFKEPIYDIHCHIIPEVDDGAASMEEALGMLEEEVRQGVECIVLTPHYRVRMFETPEEKILSRYEALCSEAKKLFPDLTLKLGCEFHAHMDMEEDFKTRKHFTMAESDYILLEFSGRHMKSFIKERTMAVLDAGYIPIIAHIERYPAMTGDTEFIGELKDRGALMQVNADAILGADGMKVKNFCKKLLKNDLIDFVDSDAHSLTHRSVHIGECADHIAKKHGEAVARRIFVENPQEIFTDKLQIIHAPEL